MLLRVFCRLLHRLKGPPCKNELCRTSASHPPLLNFHQACSRFLIPVSPDEVQGELGAYLFEGTNGVGCQPAEPDPCEALQCCGEGSAYDLVRYPLKVHQGLERLQVVQRVLVSIVIFHLRHKKFRWKGERSDGCYEWRIRSMDQVVEVA